MTKVVGIVAVAKQNNGIGANNDLLWRLPGDMAFFKQQTMGFPVITGRKNYESIPEKFRPLPGRQNIVVTRQEIAFEGADVVHSIEEGIERAKNYNQETVFVIGGGQIYKEALEKNLLTNLIITWVDGDFEADTFFPEINSKQWILTSSEARESDEKNAYPYTFTFYKKA